MYENVLAEADTNWFRVFLDTSAVPGLAPDGHGSRVYVTTIIKKQMRYMTNGDSFLSQSEMSAHYGLGSFDSVDVLEVEWPNGDLTELTEIAANQSVTLMADGPVVCAPAPAEVENLQILPITNDTRLLFTWDDLVDADSYRVLADSQPSGGFELVMGDADSGLTGLTTPMPPGDKYFLVAGRKDGCQGPK